VGTLLWQDDAWQRTVKLRSVFLAWSHNALEEIEKSNAMAQGHPQPHQSYQLDKRQVAGPDQHLLRPSFTSQFTEARGLKPAQQGCPPPNVYEYFLGQFAHGLKASRVAQVLHPQEQLFTLIVEC